MKSAFRTVESRPAARRYLVSKTSSKMSTSSGVVSIRSSYLAYQANPGEGRDIDKQAVALLVNCASEAACSEIASNIVRVKWSACWSAVLPRRHVVR
jgi:hypothetical protein